MEQALANNNASYSLLLPGKILNLTILNNLRKFRDRGNKQGAKQAWKLLDEAGLGTLIESKARRGTDKANFIFTCMTVLIRISPERNECFNFVLSWCLYRSTYMEIVHSSMYMCSDYTLVIGVGEFCTLKVCMIH